MMKQLIITLCLSTATLVGMAQNEPYRESQSLSGRACRRFVRAANLKRKGNSDAK